MSLGVINTENWSSRLEVWRPLKRLLLRNPKKGGQGPTWAVEPYDDECKAYIHNRVTIYMFR
jgi:hypothetical protein